MTAKKIGFIGLGAMGFPMAKRLVNAGFELHTSSHSKQGSSLEKTNELEGMGAIIEDDFPSVAKDMDVIITILPADKEVIEVLLDENFYNNVSSNAIIIEMTSCKADTVIAVNEAYSKKGVRVIDGPVSGGVSGAADGKLTIFGAGKKEDLASVADILDELSLVVHHIGDVGQGKTLKAINQMMVAINMMSVVEGFKIAEKAGIDYDTMYEVIKVSSGNSYAFDRKFYNLVNEKYEGGFKLSLMRKDLKIAKESVDDTSLPFLDLLYNIFLMGRDNDSFDYSVISKMYK